MEPLIRLLLRLAYWVRRPPSRSQVITAGVVIVAASLIVLADSTGFWPEWARLEWGMARTTAPR